MTVAKRIHNSLDDLIVACETIRNFDADKEYEAALNSITVEDVKKVLQDILAQGNLVQVVSAPKN